MSHENVELVQRLVEAHSRGDMDTLLTLVDSGAEFNLTDSTSPYQGIYRGHEQIGRLAQDVRDAWQEAHFEIQEPLAVGDRVLVTVTLTARGREGIEVRASGAYAVTLREGKIVGLTMFQSRADALAADRSWGQPVVSFASRFAGAS